jgi:phosphatidylglycerol:prolipoprotein diacylglycerol transferase
MDPVLVKIGPFAIRWYGVLIVAGALLAGYIASVEARRKGDEGEHAWDALSVVLITGLLGARLYHVFSSPAGSIGWEYYRRHPLDIIAFWRGGFAGLGIYGAVAGGALGMLAYTYFNKLSFARWSDYAAPGVVLAQAIGRWGNYINQELYGYATTLPWGITIDAAHRIPPFDNLAIFPLDTRFHPTFLYESLWNLLCFGLLMLLARRYGDRLLDGDVFLAYLILYPVGRFFVEGLRPDAWKVSSIPVAQIIALVSIAGAGAALWYRHHVAPRAVAAPSQVSEEEQEE